MLEPEAFYEFLASCPTNSKKLLSTAENTRTVENNDTKVLLIIIHCGRVTGFEIECIPSFGIASQIIPKDIAKVTSQV